MIFRWLMNVHFLLPLQFNWHSLVKLMVWRCVKSESLVDPYKVIYDSTQRCKLMLMSKELVSVNWFFWVNWLKFLSSWNMLVQVPIGHDHWLVNLNSSDAPLCHARVAHSHTLYECWSSNIQALTLALVQVHQLVSERYCSIQSCIAILP